MFQELYNQFCECYPQSSKQQNQNKTQIFWKTIKDSSNILQLFQSKMSELRAKKPKNTLDSFLVKRPKAFEGNDINFFKSFD